MPLQGAALCIALAARRRRCACLSGDLYEVLVWRAVVAHHHGEPVMPSLPMRPTSRRRLNCRRQSKRVTLDEIALLDRLLGASRTCRTFRGTLSSVVVTEQIGAGQARATDFWNAEVRFMALTSKGQERTNSLSAVCARASADDTHGRPLSARALVILSLTIFVQFLAFVRERTVGPRVEPNDGG